MSEREQKTESDGTADTPVRHSGERRAGVVRGAVAAAAVLAVAAVWYVQLDQEPEDEKKDSGLSGLPTVVVQTVGTGPASPPAEFIGHIEAIRSVELRAEVVGRIDTVHFQEGASVEAGDLLFTIRQAPYRARVNAAKASLARARADLVRAEKLLSRLTAADPRSVVQTDLDTADSAALQGRAAVQQAEAELELAEIDLEYTEIRAPISGKIGKAFFTKGNYVGPAVGALAELVQQDPVRVVYSLSDREYLRRTDPASREAAASAGLQLKLPDGTMYSGKGTRDFVNNRMDTGTATIAVWDEYDNPEGTLVPGTYVTVVMTDGQGDTAVRVPQEAVMADGLGYFVYTVDRDGIVDEKRLKTGGILKGHYCVLQGLVPGEEVVVKGFHRIGETGRKVRAERLPQTEGN
jgi:RND family efflux transporter MFP subunit